MRFIDVKPVFVFAASLLFVAAADAQFSGAIAPSIGAQLGNASAIGSTSAQSDVGPGATLQNGIRAPNILPNAIQPGTSMGVDKRTIDKPDAVKASLPPPRASSPTQFQRFVQETTGRLLPTYGRELFDTPQAYAADASLPVPADYVLGPGDEVQLQVWGPIDFNANLTVDRNGQVTLPKAGVISLAGVAVRDLDKTLRNHLAKVFTNFQLTANMGRLRGIQVYVVGQAERPGTYHLSSLSTLVNALFASGGPNANGSMRNIELKRGSRTVTTLDLYDFIARGDKSRDLPLAAGDVIVIPPVGPRVAITGAFDQAAIYELKASNASLADILALGGGVPALAATQKALLERISPENNPPRQVLDVALNEPGLRTPLRDGDVLTLLGISPAFANAVTLQGAVAAPLRYRWFEGMKVLDLIPERDALITADYYRRKNLLVQNADVAHVAGGSVTNRIRGQADQINWDYAVIERLDRTSLTNQLIPFNLGRAVLQRDPTQNLPLQPGDVVTVLSQSDLRVPQERQSRLVRIEGEVATPGVYQALPGETLPQLLGRVGGLTLHAYLFGAELTRESVRTRQQENLDTLIRRLDAQFQSQASVVTANRNTENAAQAQILQQQQQAQLKSQLDRLRSLKSNGRMALELDPQARNLTDLPALPLEDGDRIVVPPVPGFVSAFGSVNNENVFIFKPGKTVADVIKTAGLTEDAEPDQAFVLRADGTIVARRDRSGFFGSSFESMQVMPGDTVVVPAQIDRESRYNLVTRVFKDWTQILSNFGLGVAAIRAVTKL
jgi:protein involved in polysaccharide export with SLBB domain